MKNAPPNCSSGATRCSSSAAATRPPRLQVISERSLSLVGSPSFVLHARPQDDGAMWPALANRCQRALPTDLQWAAPLLDTGHPLPVLCGELEVDVLFRWLNAQPNTTPVSIGCRRRPAPTRGLSSAPGPRARPQPAKPRQPDKGGQHMNSPLTLRAGEDTVT
jgi:hypothetical protein